MALVVGPLVRGISSPFMFVFLENEYESVSSFVIQQHLLQLFFPMFFWDAMFMPPHVMICHS